MKKTDERKENETNSLRLWVDHTAQRLKGRSLYILVGTLVLATAAALIYRYYLGSVAAASSARILALYFADTTQKLDEIIKDPKDQSTNIAAYAKLQEARIKLYRDGIEKLGTSDPKQRETAADNIEAGRQLCKDILNDLKGNSALQQEIWLDCAKAEESLMATLKAPNSADYRGSFDEMLKDYENAAAINPESDASKGYAATIAKLKEKRADIEGFYRELNNLNFTPTLPPIPDDIFNNLKLPPPTGGKP